MPTGVYTKITKTLIESPLRMWEVTTATVHKRLKLPPGSTFSGIPESTIYASVKGSWIMIGWVDVPQPDGKLKRMDFTAAADVFELSDLQIAERK
ncbi:MAG: hypothetical protein ACAI35_05295 [Candidatus Methylacidiphilales bacterium]|nr:hypothetical protein [Candidatus Methylacidiphilales bacterium]